MITLAAFYQSLLGISVAALALGAGVAAAVQQVLATQVSATVARIALRSRLLWGGVAASVAAISITSAGALLLAGPHDLLPGYWNSDGILASPVVGLVCVGALAVGMALTTFAGIRSLRFLDLESAADAVGRRVAMRDLSAWAIGLKGDLELQMDDLPDSLPDLDIDFLLPMFWLHKINAAESEPVGASPSEQEWLHQVWKRKSARLSQVTQLREGMQRNQVRDPLVPLIELVEKTARTGRYALVESIVRRWLVRPPALPTTGIWGLSSAEAEHLIANVVFETHLTRLARRWSTQGEGDALAALSRASAVAATEGDSSVWFESNLVFSMDVSQMLLNRASGRALCSVIRDLALYAISGVGRVDAAPQRFHDEVCRALGRLGQQVPVVFKDPAEPDAFLVPNALRPQEADPVNCLLDAFEQIKLRTIDVAAPSIYPLIWRDAVLATARALADRAERAFKDARLESPLLSAMGLIADLGTAAARSGDERRAIIATFALGDLSSNAVRPYFHEYASDIALNLVEIGLFSMEHGINSTDGRPLATWIAECLVSNLKSVLKYPIHEAYFAARFEPVSHASRWSFIKEVGVVAEDNFGFRFDPATGADYAPV